MRLDFGTPDKTLLLDYNESMEYLTKLLEDYKKGLLPYVVYDSETTSLKPWEGEFICYSWADPRDDIGVTTPLTVLNRIDHDNLPFEIPEVPFQVSKHEAGQINRVAGEILANVPLIAHNAKFDLKYSIWHNLVKLGDVTLQADTMIMAFMIYGRLPGWSNGLKKLAMRLLDAPNWDYNNELYLGKYNRVKDRHFGNIPTGMLGEYASYDTHWTSKLYKYFRRKMKSLDPKMLQICQTVSNLNIPFSEVETIGPHIDQKMFEFLKTSYEDSVKELIAEMKEMPTVKEFIDERVTAALVEQAKKRKPKTTDQLRDLKTTFNLSSHDQIRSILYDKYNLKFNPHFKTDSGKPGTSKDALKFMLKYQLKENKIRDFLNQIDEEISNSDEVVAQGLRESKVMLRKQLEAKGFITSLLDNRRFEKLLSTYINPVPLNSLNGLYKPEYKLTGTVTGRLSSGFHTLPRTSDIKRMYDSRWANEGGLFLAADYSQLEVRIAAVLSGEQKLIDAYKAVVDVHRRTASEAFGVPMDKVTSEQRSDAKAIVFGLLYGKQAKSLSEDLGKSMEETEAIINGIFGGYDNLARWIKGQHEYARIHGNVITPWGRRIPIANAHSKEKHHQAERDRVAVNYPVQSTGSDVVVTALYNVWKRTKAEKRRSLLIGTVHDSIEYDIYPGELFAIAQIFHEECVKKMHEANPWLTCPLAISFELGTSWGSAVECEVKEFTEGRLVLEADGMRKDILMMVNQAKKAYNVEMEVLKKKPIDPNSFQKDSFIKDNAIWHAKIEFWPQREIEVHPQGEATWR